MINSHELVLEEKKKNMQLKETLLQQLLKNEASRYNRQWNNYLKEDIVKALG